MKIESFLGKIPVGDNFPCRIVGIVNLSSTSFYQKSISTKETIKDNVIRMIKEGADCLDIGAQSTRPIQIYGGEGRIDSEEEEKIIQNALSIVFDFISSYDNVELSVDTTRSNVTDYALKKGVRIINDISGFKKDQRVAQLIGDYDASAVVMASKNEPGDIFQITEIIEELEKTIFIGEKNKIRPDNILIDPGIGSWEARSYKHDYNIIKKLKEFRILEKSIYVGISRKTFIGKAINDAPSESRLYGSIGATMIALVNGAHVIRTHDVKPTLEAIRVGETILKYQV